MRVAGQLAGLQLDARRAPHRDVGVDACAQQAAPAGWVGERHADVVAADRCLHDGWHVAQSALRIAAYHGQVAHDARPDVAGARRGGSCGQQLREAAFEARGDRDARLRR